MSDPMIELLRNPTFHRYTITSEGASVGYFRLVEDPTGAWVSWAEVEAFIERLRAASGLQIRSDVQSFENLSKALAAMRAAKATLAPPMEGDVFALAALLLKEKYPASYRVFVEAVDKLRVAAAQSQERI